MEKTRLNKMTLEKLVRNKIFSPLLIAGTLITSTPLYAKESQLKMVSAAIEPILNFDLPQLKIYQEYNLENRLFASVGERPPYLPPKYDENGDSSSRGKKSSNPPPPNPRTAPSYAPASNSGANSSSSNSDSASNSKVNWDLVFWGLGFAGVSYLLVKSMEGCSSFSYKGGPTTTNCYNPFETVGYVGVVLSLAVSVYGLIGGK
jgi:hypothetical protein